MRLCISALDVVQKWEGKTMIKDDEDYEFQDFENKFNKTFPDFLLSPQELNDIFCKNERKRLANLSLTPKLDREMNECMDRMAEVME